MKVTVEITSDAHEPYAVIYTDKITDDIEHLMGLLSSGETPLTAQDEDRFVILQRNEVYRVRVEGGDTVIYTKDRRCYSRKRLYEIAQQLGGGFMQISKTTLVNLSYMDCIEPGFSGTMLLKLRNGCKDHVSRKYLPEFKRYLGL